MTRVFLAVLLSATWLLAASPPATVLWAWEVPEDFRFLENSDIGVAFLATSLLLREDKVLVRRRMQPMRMPAGINVLPVIRIQTDVTRRPLLSDAQRRRTAELIDEVMRTTQSNGVQIDFDALVSERKFYARLIGDLRSRIGPGSFLSITVLVSWCGERSWLKGLPADEFVPMLFSMGPEGPAVFSRLSQGGDFSARECRAAYGLSVDELRPPQVPGRRRYFFNPRPWKKQDLSSILAAK
jgi:hypothetical protein